MDYTKTDLKTTGTRRFLTTTTSRARPTWRSNSPHNRLREWNSGPQITGWHKKDFETTAHKTDTGNARVGRHPVTRLTRASAPLFRDRCFFCSFRRWGWKDWHGGGKGRQLGRVKHVVKTCDSVCSDDNDKIYEETGFLFPFSVILFAVHLFAKLYPGS